MKKSKAITLVLVTGLLGCTQSHERNRLYLRTDTSGYYTHNHSFYHGYYVFRPYGGYYGGSFMRQGYSNAGVHSSESGISRGGFGESGGHVSS
jgi:hypothetical protein